MTSVNSCPARLLRLASLLPDTVDVHHGEFVLALVEEFGVIVVYGQNVDRGGRDEVIDDDSFLEHLQPVLTTSIGGSYGVANGGGHVVV